jgi:hypothetical protein
MPPKPTTQDMGEKHETYLAALNGGRKTTSSGNQWHDQGDGRDPHDRAFAFCWDGKSTRSQQIAITLAMIAKIREQALGERPQIGLRWYGNDALDQVLEDWIAIPGADFEELKAYALRWAEIETARGSVTPEDIERMLTESGDKDDALATVQGELSGAWEGIQQRDATIAGLQEELARMTEQRDLEGRNGLRLAQELEETRTTLGMLQHERGRLLQLRIDQESAVSTDPSKAVPGYVPRLPWTVIHHVHLDGTRAVHSGISYSAEGYQAPFEVDTVRVERSPNSANRPRLIVNDLRVPQGDLYVDGKLQVRVCQDDPDIEAG